MVLFLVIAAVISLSPSITIAQPQGWRMGIHNPVMDPESGLPLGMVKAPAGPTPYIKDYIPYPNNTYPAGPLGGLFQPDSWFWQPIPYQAYTNPEDFYRDIHSVMPLENDHRGAGRLSCAICHQSESARGTYEQWLRSRHASASRESLEKNIDLSMLLASGKVDEFFVQAEIPDWFRERVPGINDVASRYRQAVVDGLGIKWENIKGPASPIFDKNSGSYKVACIDCHVKPGASRAADSAPGISLPTAKTCAVCHAREWVEFFSELTVTTPPYPPGRPSHAAGWIANISTPWYASVSRNLQHGCDSCHSIGVRGCDSCHTRHSFKARNARSAKTCQTCHTGLDQPDWETYESSRHGYINEAEPPDLNIRIAKAIPGRDYAAPTCQYCHMTYKKDKDKYVSHNFVAKGIWRMGTAYHDPSGELMGISLFPLDMRVAMDKAKGLGRTSMSFDERRSMWIDVCADCHSKRFAKVFLANMDDYMVQMNTYLLKERKQVQALWDENQMLAVQSGVREEDAVRQYFGEGGDEAEWTMDYPLGMWRGFYKNNYTGSEIERRWVENWLRGVAHGYKGAAHGSPNDSFYLGVSALFKEEQYMDENELLLRKLNNIEERLSDMEQGLGVTPGEGTTPYLTR